MPSHLAEPVPEVPDEPHSSDESDGRAHESTKQRQHFRESSLEYPTGSNKRHEEIQRLPAGCAAWDAEVEPLTRFTIDMGSLACAYISVAAGIMTCLSGAISTPSTWANAIRQGADARRVAVETKPEERAGCVNPHTVAPFVLQVVKLGASVVRS